jgi:hypothetical protein
VAAAPVVEHGDPLASAVLAQAHLAALMRHPYDGEADAAPGVEPPAHQPQVGRVVAHEHRGERRAEAAATSVQFLWSGHSITWSARTSSDGGVVRPRAHVHVWLSVTLGRRSHRLPEKITLFCFAQLSGAVLCTR